MKGLKALKVTLPLLIALSAAGPALVTASPQALAAQAKAGAPAKTAKPDPADKPAKTRKRKPAKPVKQAKVAKSGKLAQSGKTKPAKKTAKHKPAKARKLAKPPKSAKQANVVQQSGDFLLCSPLSAIRVHSPSRTYLVNNNNFEGKPECLSGSSHAPAFRVASSGATSTGPDSDSFPDIYIGCSWGRCSPGTTLPARVSKLADPVTTFDTTENAGGLWAATYDMWFDPQPIRTGQAAAEMMIWLDVKGLYNPAGMGWPVVRIDGALWYVLTWITGNGHQTWRYVQFRKYTPRWSTPNLPLKPFYQYMERQGWITPSWYALNIEAGFEIWSGGAGLTTTAFAVK